MEKKVFPMFRHVQKTTKTALDTAASSSVAGLSTLPPLKNIPFGLHDEEPELPEEYGGGPAAKTDSFEEEYDRVCSSFELIGT